MPDIQPTIIFADDDKNIQAVYPLRFDFEALEQQGYKVLMCKSGEEALEAARTVGIENVAMVSTDGNMEKMTGPQLIAELREMSLTLPIMMISSDTVHLDAADPKKAEREKAATAIFLKPDEIEAAYAFLHDTLKAQRGTGAGANILAKGPQTPAGRGAGNSQEGHGPT